MATGGTRIPAGLELVYDLEKSNVKNALDAFVLSIHWSIIRTGLRQRAPTAPNSTSTELTERLPTNWSAQETPEATRTVTHTYYDPQNPKIKYELKVIELTSNEMVAVTFFRSVNTQNQGQGQNQAEEQQATSAAASANRPASEKASGAEKNSSAATFQIPNFIRGEGFAEGQSRERAADVYEHADLLETQFYESIMEPLGLRVMGQPPVQGPYDDVTKEPEKANPPRRDPLADERFTRPDFGRRPSPLNPGMPFGPLHVPPIGGGLGGLGHSDLDPLGRIGAGNVLDPRGFRGPRGPGGGLGGIGPGFPGGIPPGARFDPFGPPNPNRPDGGTGGQFALPNPDHERPPSSDYDDMFM